MNLISAYLAEHEPIDCPDCGGEGFNEIPTHMDIRDGYVYTRDERCERCDGIGQIEVHGVPIGVDEHGDKWLISQTEYEELTYVESE